MLNKILVAIATPESNHYVFDQALMLAKSMNAHLGLIHVTDPDEAGDDLPAYLDPMEPYLGEDGDDSCCYMGHFEAFEPDLFGGMVGKATAEGVSTDCIHCFGDPERIINDFALAWKPDLIMLGRRGRSGIVEFFLGSVSNYTLHHAPCSVYIVSEPVDVNPGVTVP
jgi:nucleotide-binding universal stress UspA family protein